MADSLVLLERLNWDNESDEKNLIESFTELSSEIRNSVPINDSKNTLGNVSQCCSTPQVMLYENNDAKHAASAHGGESFSASKVVGNQNDDLKHDILSQGMVSSSTLEMVLNQGNHVAVTHYEESHLTPEKLPNENVVSKHILECHSEESSSTPEIVSDQNDEASDFESFRIEESHSVPEIVFREGDHTSSVLMTSVAEVECENNVDIVKNMEMLDIECRHGTALVYDERMSKYYCKEKHVERPQRITSIYEKLCDEGLVSRCMKINSRVASTDELLTKHCEKYVDIIKSIKEKSDDELDKLAMDYDSIYFHPAVTECALLAVGCTLNVVEEVIIDNALNGVAVIRPPGHHALNHCAMGFCYFNNVAIAAMHAIEKFGLSRVLIVDWDVHYGNGTHKMFESDPRVLFFSLHRYDHQLFWPCLAEGNFDSVGIGDGEGFNIHVAWNRSKMGDPEYLLAFEQILIPVANEYNPQLIIVSSGFDSGDGDSLGQCKVTPAGYAHMTRKLMNLANGKVVIVLEGGYNLKTISNSMAACVSSLLNDPLPHLELSSVRYEGWKSIQNTLLTIQKYWNSLQGDFTTEFLEAEKNSDDREFSSDESSSSDLLDEYEAKFFD